ncbi:MAG: C10 family peptidase [Alistipes sp.]|nr:C10 family peptidase [Alistipes sp.]MBP3433620.1 C10 family peptidase [Alistipes sp.]
MKRLLLLLTAIGVVAVSCQKDIAYSDMSEKETSIEVKISPYAVSEEKALSRLESELATIKGVETRASNRSVRTIKPIKFNDIAPATRSSDIDVDNLLYIVEFEDGQGSAILGADERVEPIYAILDESVLTEEDFQNATNCENRDNISTFTAGLIAQSAINSVSTYGLLPDQEITSDFYDIEEEKVSVIYIPPMLFTKWGQNSPYNDEFPMTNDNSTYYYIPYAGCGAISVAQILTYHQVSPLVNINNRIHLYSDVSRFNIYNDYQLIDDYYKTRLGYFIYDIAVDMNSVYKPDGTSTSTYSAAKLLRKSGLSGVLTKYSMKEDVVNDMLNEGNPVWIRAEDDNGTPDNDDDNKGHAWVIDGRRYTQTSLYKVTIRDGQVISREFMQSYLTNYIHCNFGWSGDCDGYYNYNVYDLTYRKSGEMYEPMYGDVDTTRNRVYQLDINLIKYHR